MRPIRGVEGGAKIGGQSERSNSGQSGEIQLKFHGTGLLEFVKRQIVKDSLVKLEVPPLDLAIRADRQFGAFEVHRVNPDHNQRTVNFLFEIAMYDI